MKRFITITLDEILHQENYYLHCAYCREFADLNMPQYVSFTDSEHNMVITYMRENISTTEITTKLEISRQTWSKYKDSAGGRMKRYADQPVALMPWETFDALRGKMADMPMNRKVALFKIYAYLFFCDGYYRGDFQSSQSAIAAELGSSVKYINKALKLFIDWGLLIRSGKYRFSGENTFSYKHTIPPELKMEDLFTFSA